MERSANGDKWVKKLFTEQTGGPWSWAPVGLGVLTGFLVANIIQGESAGDILFGMVATAIGVTIAAFLWKAWRQSQRPTGSMSKD